MNEKLMSDLELAKGKVADMYMAILKADAQLKVAQQKGEDKKTEAVTKLMNYVDERIGVLDFGLTSHAMEVQARIDGLENESLSKKVELEKAIEDLESLKLKVASEESTVKANWERTLANTNEAYTREIANLNASHQSSIAILKAKLATEVETLTTSTLSSHLESKGFKVVDTKSYGTLTSLANKANEYEVKAKEAIDVLNEAKSKHQLEVSELTAIKAKLEGQASLKDEKINDQATTIKELKESNSTLQKSLVSINQPKS
jgi:hypothetical protein